MSTAMKQQEMNRARMLQRRSRVRGKARGTAERPRLSVHRSLAHIYAQVIDDSTGRTLASASTLSPEVKAKGVKGGNIKAAELVGTQLAEVALGKGIKKVCFDRGGYMYHGRVKAVADAARKGGLDF